MFAFLQRTSEPGMLSLISNTPLVFLLFIILKEFKNKEKNSLGMGQRTYMKILER